MGTKSRSQVPSERKRWDNIFNSLVKMLQSQQEQLESLAKERKILDDRVKMQQERWESDIRLYEGHLAQMKGDLVAKEMMRVLESAKSDFVVGLKQKEASQFKWKLEQSEDELADFKAWFEILSQCPKENPLGNSDLKFVGSKRLEGEAIKLRLECEKLALQKNSEISALLAEKKFVWNQLNIMEEKLSNKLVNKDTEVERANETIKKLLADVEQMQSSHNRKDETIARLKSEMAETMAEANKLKDENSKLSRELELLRKSKSVSVTPVLNRCTAGASSSTSGGKNSDRNGSNIFVSKQLAVAQAAKGSQNLKRKQVDVISISETPKLFTSTFKVPKLKISSPRVR